MPYCSAVRTNGQSASLAAAHWDAQIPANTFKVGVPFYVMWHTIRLTQLLLEEICMQHCLLELRKRTSHLCLHAEIISKKSM